MGNNNSKIRFFINHEVLFTEPGTKISDLLRNTSGVDMPCGGRHACGKCMVYAHVKWADGKWNVHVIGEKNAAGICGCGDLACLYVAGGFGSCMSVESAERIGLFPKIDPQRIRICKNAALAGAERILHREECEKETSDLAKRAETVNLGSSAEFQNFYMEHMMFNQ